ncbi:MAG: ATP-binding cassette domain-containing protein, partial [Geminicoccaceae bacterium]|nr:ATP-binding cassette domain-containing protein [Geminicoccaceae bacterium]
MTPLLELRGITRRFGPLIANDAVDLALHRGEILALLGENGAGKTTLMSILFGHYVADSGQVLLDGRPLAPGSPRAALAAGIGMVHQHFTLAANMSVLDNVILGTRPITSLRPGRARARRRLSDLIDRTGLEVPLDARIGDLAIGERQRVELLKALYRDARVLILDEPTAVLTPQQTEKLFVTLRGLAEGGLGIVFISHKLDEVVSLCHRVAVLRHGRKVLETTTALHGKAALARAMVDRAIPPPVLEPREAGAPVLVMRAVSVEGGPGREALHEIDLEIRGGRVLGIAGVSGNGQRSLADFLAGLVAPRRGSLELDGRPWPEGGAKAVVRAGIGRVPEDRHEEGVVGDMAVWENLALEGYDAPACRRWGLLNLAAFRRRAGALIERFDIRCTGPDARTRLLSGGNM